MSGPVQWEVQVGFEGIIVVTGQPVGLGTVRYLDDASDPEALLNSLTPVESAVLAARLRTWAEHLDGRRTPHIIPPGAMRCSVAGCLVWIDAGTPTATATAMRHHEREAHNQ